MTPAILRLPVVAALGFFLGACSPTDNPNTGKAAETTPKKAEPAFFVGTIRLLERRAILGDDLDYITFTLNGPRLRREVRPNSFADSTERYGIIADLRTDSVTYYVQDATHNVHCRFSRTEYLKTVAADAPVLTSLDRRPYRSAFAPLPTPAGSLQRVVKPVPAFNSLRDCQAMLFFLDQRTRCEAIYSEQVRVPAEVIAYVEHHQPAPLPTLALAVHYTTADSSRQPSLLRNLRNRVRQHFFPDVQFSGLDSFPPPPRAFDLPAGSRYHSVDDLQILLTPPASRWSSSYDD